MENMTVQAHWKLHSQITFVKTKFVEKQNKYTGRQCNEVIVIRKAVGWSCSCNPKHIRRVNFRNLTAWVLTASVLYVQVLEKFHSGESFPMYTI